MSDSPESDQSLHRSNGGSPATTARAMTALGGGTAQLMRDFTIPFAEDMLAEAQAAGWSTDPPPIQVGDRTIDLGSIQGPAVAALGHDLTVGLFAYVGAKVGPVFLDALLTDIYAQLLKKPLANLWERVRRKPLQPASTIRVVTDVWLAEVRLMLHVEVVASVEDGPPDVASSLRVAARATRPFLREVESKTGDGDGSAILRRVKVTIDADGTVTAQTSSPSSRK